MSKSDRPGGPGKQRELPVVDLSDDENEDWLRTVRKQRERAAVEALAKAGEGRRADEPRERAARLSGAGEAVLEFDKQAAELQVAWRRRHVSTRATGTQNGHRREWILPQHLWEEGLWPGIRSDSTHSLANYVATNGIKKHDGAHNLKSSWVACANLFFPFQRDPLL